MMNCYKITQRESKIYKHSVKKNRTKSVTPSRVKKRNHKMSTVILKYPSV